MRQQNKLSSPLRPWSFVSFCTSLLLTSPLSLPLYPLWGRTTKNTWGSQDWTGKMCSPQWEGNDLKAPNERTPYLSPSGEPLGTPSHMWCNFVSLWVYRDLYTLAKQVSEGCLTCRKINKQALRQREAAGRNPGLGLFQSIQVDYTEMPKIGNFKYLFVIVDHLTHWVEAIPLPGATATNVIRVY
jgi:hypothetical protein